MSQCTSCGGFCKRSGCERADYVPTECPKCKEWEAVCDQHLRHIKKLKKQRTWVGLTDEEVEKLIDDAGFTRTDLLMIGACVSQIIDEVEAKLKQKNGFAEEKNT